MSPKPRYRCMRPVVPLLVIGFPIGSAMIHVRAGKCSVWRRLNLLWTPIPIGSTRDHLFGFPIGSIRGLESTLIPAPVQQSSPGRVSFEAGDRDGHFLSSRRTPQLALEEVKKSKTRSTHVLSMDLGGLRLDPCWGHMTGLWAFCILSPHSRSVLNGNLGGLVVGSR
ncbi:hypothetical protein ACLB2K_040343 [Fragaria x ananassa]